MTLLASFSGLNLTTAHSLITEAQHQAYSSLCEFCVKHRTSAGTKTLSVNIIQHICTQLEKILAGLRIRKDSGTRYMTPAH